MKRWLVGGMVALLASAGGVSAQSADSVGGVPADGLVGTVEDAHDYDPWEGFNRGVFWFNDHLDVYVLEPTARGWDFVVPDRAQTSLANFFRNLRFPIHVGNNLFQGKVGDATHDVGRFAVNTTIGVAGFFDPATDFGIHQSDEDFGQTLGWWGVGSGPYVVLPVFGASTARDTVGLAANWPMAVYPFFVDTIYTIGPTVVETVNTRARYLETVEQAKDAAVDYYTFVRSAYLQRRAALVEDRTITESPPHDEEDLYFPEDE